MRAHGPHAPLVLLVDDDTELLQFTELLLARRGLRVVTAPNGRVALRMLETVHPDVIVTDMVMPELDGLQLIAEYASRSGRHAPVVAVSGFLPYLEEARKLGVAAALAKPYNPRALADLVLELARGERSDIAEPTVPEEHDGEQARLRAVFDLRLDDWEPEPRMQRFLDDVAGLFDVPVAGVSVVTQHRQRLVVQCSTAPADQEGGSRESSFCSHAVAARSALIIQDAHENPLFRDNPSVTERGFRFYAGVPLMTWTGHAIGTLCILDFEPHTFTHVDLELLGLLGQRVVAALEWREKRAHPEIPDSAFRYLQCVDEQLDVYGKALFSDLVSVEATRALERGEPAALVGLSLEPEGLEETVARLRDQIGRGMIGRLGLDRIGIVLPGRTVRAAVDLVRETVSDGAVMAVTALDRYQGATGMALHQIEQSLE